MTEFAGYECTRTLCTVFVRGILERNILVQYIKFTIRVDE